LHVKGNRVFSSLLPTDEQNDLRATVRRFLRDHENLEGARRVAETGQRDPKSWTRLVAEIGAGYLMLPERAGGLPNPLVELCILAEEGGYQLLTSPLVPSVLTARALTHAEVDDEGAWELLTSGEYTVAPVLSGTAGPWSPDAVAVSAENGRLSGQCRFVVDDATADWLLVAAKTASGLALYLVDAQSAGVTRAPVTTFDRTRTLSSISFGKATGRELPCPGNVDDAVARAYDDTFVTLAAEQIGVAQRALDMAVEYAKTREQFGRPIGSFQAVKHLLADCLVGVESARSALTVAAHTDGDLRELASLTLSRCSEIAVKVTEASIQAHGGIGYTWEHDAHLLLKRARANALLLGTPSNHRKRVLNAIGA